MPAPWAVCFISALEKKEAGDFWSLIPFRELSICGGPQRGGGGQLATNHFLLFFALGATSEAGTQVTCHLHAFAGLPTVGAALKQKGRTRCYWVV